jgi:pantetheine-phosphate adenylyltransferase
MLKAAFPGSFDPPTFGHLNIIERSAMLFDELIVLVAGNRGKKCLFTAQERVDMLRELVKPWKNVSVDSCDKLVVDYLGERGILLMIRGVRGMGDFSYEFEVSMMNKAQNPKIETLFMASDPRFVALRSSSIKELAQAGGDTASLIPPLAVKALRKKLQK